MTHGADAVEQDLCAVDHRTDALLVGGVDDHCRDLFRSPACSEHVRKQKEEKRGGNGRERCVLQRMSLSRGKREITERFICIFDGVQQRDYVLPGNSERERRRQ